MNERHGGHAADICTKSHMVGRELAMKSIGKLCLNSNIAAFYFCGQGIAESYSRRLVGFGTAAYFAQWRRWLCLGVQGGTGAIGQRDSALFANNPAFQLHPSPLDPKIPQGLIRTRRLSWVALRNQEPAVPIEFVA